MDVKSAYKFLKHSLEEFTDQQKQELSRLITGKPAEEKRKEKKVDPVMSIAEMKKRLLKSSHFKNKQYN